jgi:hypothetical protein
MLLRRWRLRISAPWPLAYTPACRRLATALVSQLASAASSASASTASGPGTKNLAPTARWGALSGGPGASSPLVARGSAIVGAWCRLMAGKCDEGGGKCEGERREDESEGRAEGAAPHATGPGSAAIARTGVERTGVERTGWSPSADKSPSAASLRRISHRLTSFSFQVPAEYDYCKATNENYGVDARSAGFKYFLFDQINTLLCYLFELLNKIISHSAPPQARLATAVASGTYGKSWITNGTATTRPNVNRCH